eukprot:1151659-Pleurochrysis_carterae.AAC.1
MDWCARQLTYDGVIRGRQWGSTVEPHGAADDGLSIGLLAELLHTAHVQTRGEGCRARSQACSACRSWRARPA